jgi:tellurite resistance protein TerC
LSNLARAAVWIGLGLALGAGIGAARGSNAAAEYYAAFFLEESLSIDNIFVFTLIFSELHIPDEYRRRVLRFGVLGALAFRALVIGGGITLINRFSWVTYPFAVIMLFAAWRLAFGQERERRAVEAACNVCQSWVARIVPVSPVLRGQAFWRREGKRLVATPLLVAIVLIETTDIVFALDSVPAVLSVTRDSLIVYTSNVMAMIGLRSLYFVVSDALSRLRFLRFGLGAILVFTAAKMLTSSLVHISALTSVLVIGSVLLATIAASWFTSQRGSSRLA